MSETITVSRAGQPTGAYDGQGNPILGPPTTISMTIKAFAPAVGPGAVASNETPEIYGTHVVSGGTIYGYRGQTFLPSDIITIRGDLWHIEGEIGDWAAIHPGGPEGVVVAVRRST